MPRGSSWTLAVIAVLLAVGFVLAPLRAGAATSPIVRARWGGTAATVTTTGTTQPTGLRLQLIVLQFGGARSVTVTGATLVNATPRDTGCTNRPTGTFVLTDAQNPTISRRNVPVDVATLSLAVHTSAPVGSRCHMRGAIATVSYTVEGPADQQRGSTR